MLISGYRNIYFNQKTMQEKRSIGIHKSRRLSLRFVPFFFSYVLIEMIDISKFETNNIQTVFYYKYVTDSLSLNLLNALSNTKHTHWMEYNLKEFPNI